MLVLSRKVNETIHIGNDIVITIRRVRGKTVAVAIDAPRLVSVMRGELREAANQIKESQE